MGNEWQTVPLGEAVEVLDSRRIPVKENDRKKGAYPYYGASGIVDYVDDYIFEGLHLLIAEDGENLRTKNTPVAFLADGKFWVNNHAHIVIANDTATTRYLSYALQIADFSAFLTGSTMPKLTQQNMLRIPISRPPLPTQKAIAHILGTLDDKIELLRSMNETLEAMARGLFKSWFIDFDPVRKKTGGQPTGLPPEIDALFPDSFMDSELGEIPKGWEAVPLSSHFGFLPGYAFKSQDWAESGIPVIKIGSVKPGFVDLSQVSFVSEEIAITANRFRLKVGDIVIGMTGYVGEVGLIPNTKNPPLLNQRVGKFVLTREGTSELGFIYCLTRRKEFKSMVETNSHGTAQANVSSEGIMSIKTVFPKKSLYDAFNAKTQNLFDTLLSNKYEMDILESIRDSLLPKLISGEIELSDKDISKIMEPAK